MASVRAGPVSVSELMQYPTQCLHDLSSGPEGAACARRLSKNLSLNCIAVSDYSGIGIPENCLQQIFEVARAADLVPYNMHPIWWRACDYDVGAQFALLHRPEHQRPMHCFSDIHDKVPPEVKEELNELESDQSMNAEDQRQQCFVSK